MAYRDFTQKADIVGVISPLFSLNSLVVKDYSKRDIFLELFAVLGILLENNWD